MQLTGPVFRGPRPRGVRPTVPGRRRGAAEPIVVGGKPKPQLTERQLARERAKLAHAAQGHLSVAAEHRAAGRLEQAKVHEALASDLPGAYRAMAKELADRAAKSADRHESRSLAAQAAKLRERADEVAAILPKATP